MKQAIFFILLVVSRSVASGQECILENQNFSYDAILKYHHPNSQLRLVNDTLVYALDPILSYQALKVDSNSARYHSLYDAVAMINVFERLLSDQPAMNEPFFQPYLATLKEKVCSAAAKDTADYRRIKWEVTANLNNAIVAYADLNHYTIRTFSNLRGSPKIKVRFVSTPGNATMRYILAGYVLLYHDAIPELLWSYVSDGQIIQLQELTTYTIQSRWSVREPWQQENKEADKIDTVTILPIVKHH